MTQELQSTLQALGMRWPAMRNHIPWMVHVIQLALSVFLSNPGVPGRTMSWEAHERDQEFRENESTTTGKNQRLRNEGNAGINKVWAMRPGLAKIIEKVLISRHCERPQRNLHKADNACCVNYADTWLSKWVHWRSQGQSLNSSTSDYGCESTVEFNIGVPWVSLPNTIICPGLAEESKLQRLPATLHHTRWMDTPRVHHGSFEAIPILDHVDVEKAYSYSASCHHCLQWHLQSSGWRYATFR